MTITATRQPSTGTVYANGRASKACTRCGRLRQFNPKRPPADLCKDCTRSDPGVWERTSWVVWDGTEGDDDDE